MRLWSAVLIVTVGAALDLAAKAWARANLEPYGPSLDFLPIVSLRLTFNEGVSFSMFAFEGELGQTLLLIATGILSLGIGMWAYRSQGWQRGALALIAAGAFANLIDRAARGVVTDFLALHFWEWHPFVFNLADVWISAGAVALLICWQRPASHPPHA